MGKEEERKGLSQDSPGFKRMIFKPGVVSHHLLGMESLIKCKEDISGIAIRCPVTSGLD